MTLFGICKMGGNSSEAENNETSSRFFLYYLPKETVIFNNLTIQHRVIQNKKYISVSFGQTDQIYKKTGRIIT